MLSKTPLYCVAVKILMMAVPATAQVMTKSPSPAQASPQPFAIAADITGIDNAGHI